MLMNKIMRTFMLTKFIKGTNNFYKSYVVLFHYEVLKYYEIRQGGF